MRNFEFDIQPLGDHSLLIQVKSSPTQELLHWLLAKRSRLMSTFQVEVIHTYNELLIKNISHYRESLGNFKSQISVLLEIPELCNVIDSKLHRIPVCYNELYARDLLNFSKTVKLSISEIIALHTTPIYPIYFLGFLPGFPYLNGLDEALHLDRKTTPSQVVQAGSVAIGGKQTGIYPQESPGGWHIIGRTPVALFDCSQKNPSPFKAGDSIQFYEISILEFEELQKDYSN